MSDHEQNDNYINDDDDNTDIDEKSFDSKSIKSDSESDDSDESEQNETPNNIGSMINDLYFKSIKYIIDNDLTSLLNTIDKVVSLYEEYDTFKNKSFIIRKRLIDILNYPHEKTKISSLINFY